MTDVVRISGATVRRGQADILRDITWTVGEGERWVVLGPNGAGKTTLLALAGARVAATSGEVALLGAPAGTFDTAELRSRIGLSSDVVAQRLPDGAPVRDTVITAAHGIDARHQEPYGPEDFARADALLAALGLQDFADREYATLSEGERKRVQIARSLMPDPELLLLDEPSAGLDLGGREELLAALTELAADPLAPVMVLVTHHVEEVPAGFTHALLMRDGAVVAQGPIGTVLTDENLTTAYGLPVSVAESSGRWTARIAPPR